VAGYWSSPPLIGTRQFLDWLGMGAEDRSLGLFYLGWPKVGFVPRKATRSPIEEKLTWHGE
jgi:hypothetical protein